ncbi:unnamed protein product [Eruca vesicaria subsp. sativa]|uniref:FBD domain-containing protein n=1 Tax=Eruca vesicaria subsp. sativa TaxID=29727 RepID=A0ABC8KUQ2_ERUVS|nr:unnamed protein product [Eruca vesicaria subsp. sativa]
MEVYPSVDFHFSNFFNGISTARDMFISELTMEIISSYFKVEQFPQFCNLSSLEAEVCLRRLDILRMLPTFLESFPNLKSIVLDITHSVDTLPIALSSVPQCLLSSLEFVEIKSRYEAEFVLMELAKYFARNSTILKKLIVRWNRSKLEEDTVLRDLLASQWRSSTCQIEVCDFISLSGHRISLKITWRKYKRKRKEYAKN